MAETPEAYPDATLVAFVRGRLPEDEAARVAAAAAAEPALAAEIALVRGIARAEAAAAAEHAPGELGWARLARALDREAPPKPARRPVWQFGAAAAAAVLVWQVAAVPLLSPGREEATYAPVSETPAGGVTLLVAFRPGTTEAAMRELLRATGAEVTGGPSAIGLWQLGFTDGAARDSALARLADDPIVESAQLP
jgi:hypothetical protein